MEHNPPPYKKENYKFLAKLSWNDIHELRIPCKVFLPQKVFEHPQVYIYPNAEQFNILPDMKKCHLYGSIGDPIEIEIIGEHTHISGGWMRHWEPGLEEGYRKVYPSRLIIIKHFNTDRYKSEESSFLFKLTPSLLLSPFDMREFHYTGEAKMNHGKRFHFKIEDGFDIEFLNYYKWINLRYEEALTYPELVAIAKLACQPKEDDIQRYISLIDDFLLLVSLAENRRCVIPQYEQHLSNSIIEIYRLDKLIPVESHKHSANDLLIDFADFRNFMNNSWKSLRSSSQYELIKTALLAITSDVPKSIESKFMSLYSSIETLILAFRRDNNFEFILKEPGQVESFEKDLKSLIKKHEYFRNNKDARSLIYQNISGFLRLPLKRAFEEFIKTKGLDFSDLWPFFDDNLGCSLTKIRHRLVHGYGLAEQFLNSFVIALECLKYYAKRLLLASLNWDFQESRLFRMPDSEIEKWKDARANLHSWD